MKKLNLGIFFLLFALQIGFCMAAGRLSLASPTLSGGTVPRKCTCDGQSVSPALFWKPTGIRAKSFALIVTDPDAPSGTFVHWVIYNIPSGKHGLPEGVPAVQKLPDGTLQGMNHFNRIGYGGPCPPPGQTHRYIFTLYALNAKLNLAPGATKEALFQAMAGHIAAQGTLMARYHR